MKLTILGTSHGVSERGRYCSSSVLETNGLRYVVDTGAPVDYLFVNRGWTLESIRGVFLTHMHIDHVGTLPFLVEYLSGQSAVKYVQKREGRGDSIPPVTVTFPETAGRDAFLCWMKALHAFVEDGEVERPFWSKSLRLQSLEECDRYEDEAVRVQAIPTRHLPKGSYAYDIRAEGKRVLFTGDLRHTFSDFPKIAQAEEFDLIVCEYTHYPPEVALPVLKECKTKRLVFNHVCDPDGAREKWLAEHLWELPYPVTLVRDGTEIEI